MGRGRGPRTSGGSSSGGGMNGAPYGRSPGGGSSSGWGEYGPGGVGSIGGGRSGPGSMGMARNGQDKIEYQFLVPSTKTGIIIGKGIFLGIFFISQKSSENGVLLVFPGNFPFSLS